MMRNQSGNRTCFALLADRLSSNYLLLDQDIPLCGDWGRNTSCFFTTLMLTYFLEDAHLVVV